MSRSKYPESSKHIEEAIADGQQAELTLDRKNASKNRKESLKKIKTIPDMDRDGYPLAMTKESGKGAHVKHIPKPDNRGSGSSIGNQLRGIPDGEKFKIVVVDRGAL